VLAKLNIPAPGAGAGEKRFRLQYIQEMMSLSDGQINLCNKLYNKGQRCSPRASAPPPPVPAARAVPGASAGGGAERGRPPPSPLPPVLTGHVSSLLPY